MKGYRIFRSGKGFVPRVLIAMAVMTLFMACSAFTAQAKPKLSTKKVTLMSGKTKKVKLKGAKGETTWTSSNPNVARVTKNRGSSVKIEATGAGKAKITAKNRGKKYTLTVKVNGIRNPGEMRPGRAVTLKATKIGKKIRWTSSNTYVVTVDKKSGRAVMHNPGRAKITAKGSRGKAYVTISVAAAPSGSGGSGGTAVVVPGPSYGSDDPQTGGGGITGGGSTGGSTYTPTTPSTPTTPATPTTPTYPVISNNPKYHYEITVLNDGTYSSYPSRVYTNKDLIINNRRQCALIFVKTNAPFNGSEYTNGNIPLPYKILVDGVFNDRCARVNIPDNVHKDASGRPVGGDVWIINAVNPGVHTIEIVEDLVYGWDSSLGKDVIKSYTKTGVTRSIRFYDYEAEEAQWINETVARYTNSGMTDREKTIALQNVLWSDSFDKYFYNIQLPDGTIDRMDKITYMNYTAFWVNGIGDCSDANWYFQELLKKAGVTCRSAGSGSHVYTQVYYDSKWVNYDATGSHHTIPYSDLIFIN